MTRKSDLRALSKRIESIEGIREQIAYDETWASCVAWMDARGLPHADKPPVVVVNPTPEQEETFRLQFQLSLFQKTVEEKVFTASNGISIYVRRLDTDWNAYYASRDRQIAEAKERLAKAEQPPAPVPTPQPQEPPVPLPPVSSPETHPSESIAPSPPSAPVPPIPASQSVSKDFDTEPAPASPEPESRDPEVLEFFKTVLGRRRFP